MNFFDPKQWLVVLLFALACVLGYNFWSARLVAEGDAAGYARAAAEYNVKLVAAQGAAAKQTKEWQDEKDEAERRAQGRIDALKVLARNITTERNGLRDELAAARRQLPTASCSSVREHAATLNRLFESCVERYTAVAEAASGHASDSLKFQQAWPK